MWKSFYESLNFTISVKTAVGFFTSPLVCTWSKSDFQVKEDKQYICTSVEKMGLRSQLTIQYNISPPNATSSKGASGLLRLWHKHRGRVKSSKRTHLRNKFPRWGNKKKAKRYKRIDYLLHKLRQIGSACDAIPILKHLDPNRLKGLS